MITLRLYARRSHGTSASLRFLASFQLDSLSNLGDIAPRYMKKLKPNEKLLARPVPARETIAARARTMLLRAGLVGVEVVGDRQLTVAIDQTVSLTGALDSLGAILRADLDIRDDGQGWLLVTIQ